MTHDISQTTATNYLEELVEEERLRTWYDKARYYDLPIDNEEIIPVLTGIIEKNYLFKTPMTIGVIKQFLEENYGLQNSEATELIMSLVNDGIIRNYKQEGVVYFAPQRLPLSIKIFLLMLGITSLISILLGYITGQEQGTHLVLPISLSILSITCAVWYCQEKKIIGA